MAEGLNPIETGKKRNEHGEAPHQPAEGEDGHGESGGHHARIVQICEAVPLALVTVTAAWAGYSAAKVGHGIAGRHRPGLDPGQSRYPGRPHRNHAAQLRLLNLQRVQ